MERGNNCEICGKVLTDKDHNLRSAMDWLYTCEKHNKFAWYSKIEVAKKAAGFKYFKLKNINCEICDKPIEPKQLLKAGIHTANFVCKKHKEAESWYQLDMAKKWFEYKEKVNPNAKYETDVKDFRAWWIENK